MENTTVERQHSLGLILFLVLIMLASSYTCYLYFTSAEPLSQAIPKASPTLIYVLGGLALVNICSAGLVFFWKRIGVYSFYVMSVIAYSVNEYLGLGALSSMTGLLGAVILYFATRKKWSFFN